MGNVSGRLKGGVVNKAQYAELVIEGIRRHPQVVDVDEEMTEITSKYGDYDQWDPVDQTAITRLEWRYAEAVELARGELEKFWSRVRPGAMFVHKRFITVDKKPVVCAITKITYCCHGQPFMIYYRLDEGSGLRTKCEPNYFAEHSFKEWVG